MSQMQWRIANCRVKLGLLIFSLILLPATVATAWTVQLEADEQLEPVYFGYDAEGTPANFSIYQYAAVPHIGKVVMVLDDLYSRETRSDNLTWQLSVWVPCYNGTDLSWNIPGLSRSDCLALTEDDLTWFLNDFDSIHLAQGCHEFVIVRTNPPTIAIHSLDYSKETYSYERQIIIMGTGFYGISDVILTDNGTVVLRPEFYTVNNSGNITCLFLFNDSITEKTYDIQVSALDGRTDVLEDAYEYVKPREITAILWAEPAEGVFSLTDICFNITVDGYQESWELDFGDGTGCNITLLEDFNATSHHYRNHTLGAGLYDATLTLNATGNPYQTSTDIAIAPLARMITPTNASPGEPLEFQDISLGSPDSWLWDFGDGIISTEQNPNHTYSTDGIHTVTLDASRYGIHNTTSEVLLVCSNTTSGFNEDNT